MAARFFFPEDNFPIIYIATFLFEMCFVCMVCCSHVPNVLFRIP